MTHLLFVWRICSWLIFAAWLRCAFEAARGLRKVTNLLDEEFATASARSRLTVIVPARNEEADVGACLESLLAQDVEGLRVVAVDDRSTDRTGAVMEEIALRVPGRLEVIHVSVLPAGWLGKTHAMHTAAMRAESEYLLFTDADVTFRPDALRRALAYAETVQADHLVVAPTTVIRRWDEAGLLGFFQTLGLWAARPWRVADPQARDAIGIGAFNMIRREAYERTGGYAALRMEVVEDLGLGRMVKRTGLAQRVAFGRGLVNIHWASGVDGLIGVMTKNMFAGFRYSIWLLLLGCVWLTGFCVMPFAGALYGPLLLPSLLTVGCIAVSYRVLSPISGLSAWNFFLAPFAASLFVFTLLRSMLTTIRQGGVLWRGTFYSLKELRRELPPLRDVLRPRRAR